MAFWNGQVPHTPLRGRRARDRLSLTSLRTPLIRLPHGIPPTPPCRICRIPRRRGTAASLPSLRLPAENFRLLRDLQGRGVASWNGKVPRPNQEGTTQKIASTLIPKPWPASDSEMVPMPRTLHPAMLAMRLGSSSEGPYVCHARSTADHISLQWREVRS